MSSLVGYVTATYDQLVEAFGEPTYSDWSGDYKVSTEWDLMLDLVEVRIYDWKEVTKEAFRDVLNDIDEFFSVRKVIDEE